MSATHQALQAKGGVMGSGLVVLLLAMLLGIQSVTTDLACIAAVAWTLMQRDGELGRA